MFGSIGTIVGGILGGTGTGKSATLNAIFQTETAKVGHSFAPEMMNVDSHMLNDNFRLWDTLGLGDGFGNDKSHARKITELLHKPYGDHDVLLLNIHADIILTVINQCDMAISGRHWDFSRSVPDRALRDFLDGKADSIQRRIRETTGTNIIRPVYYSAEYGYNIERVLLIIDHIPLERRRL